MKRSVAWGAGVVLAGALAVPSAAADGDPEAGREKAGACAGCHGGDGIGVSPEVPNLAGQKAPYLVSALEAYQNGLRKHPIMGSIARGLSEQDMQDLAAYYSRL